MNTNLMNLIFVVPFLLFAVVGSEYLPELQEKFRVCRKFLDDHAKTDCERAQNIHLCTEMLNGQIKSRGNQELDRLKCTEKVKDCKTSDIRTCNQRKPDSCSDLKAMKKCFYRQNCTEHYNLLDKYYTNVCLKTVCNSTDVKNCVSEAAGNTQKAVCENLKTEYECVLNKRSSTDDICKMPDNWQKDYKDNNCEYPCYEINKHTLNNKTDEDKCELLNGYKHNLDTKNCAMTDDMKNEYKSSKCDTRCNSFKCPMVIGEAYTRKQICRQAAAFKCMENAKCPVEQKFYDAYAFYGCSTSCNGNVYTECLATVKEPLNSTREEQCGFYREQRECADKSKCEMTDTYSKILECSVIGLRPCWCTTLKGSVEQIDPSTYSCAASWNTMLTSIIPALLTVKMLDKYISLS